MPIYKASTADVATIRSLAEAIWMKHYPAIIGEAQTLYMLDAMYASDLLTKQIEEERYDFYIWQENQAAIAFAAIDCKNHPHGFLSKFYLDEQYRGKGVAQTFLHHLETVFRENGKADIQLTVNRQNVGAINFYFKSGFKILRCEDFNIGNGYFMNDFVMGKTLD